MEQYNHNQDNEERFEEIEALLSRVGRSVVPDPAVLRSALNHTDVGHASLAQEVRPTAARGGLAEFFSSWNMLVPSLAVVVLVVAAVFGANNGTAPTQAPLAMNDGEGVSPVSEMMMTEVAPDMAPQDARMMKSAPQAMMMSVASMPEASGNVDDIVNSLLGEADADTTLFADASGDPALVNEDATTLADIQNSYDPNQL